MSSSNAQRQRAYRERHLKGTGNDGDMLERVNLLVSVHAKAALIRLSARYGVTQRTLLEQLIGQAEQALTASLDGEALELYYQATDPLRRNAPHNTPQTHFGGKSEPCETASGVTP